MDPEVKQELNTPDFLNSDEAGKIAPFNSMSDSNEQLQSTLKQVKDFLGDVPEYLSEFFSEYKRPIVTIGLAVGTIIAFKLLLAILDAINDVPLLQPTFELVGMGYSAWFIYRYLLRASNREELGNDFKTLKDQVLGQGGKNS